MCSGFHLLLRLEIGNACVLSKFDPKGRSYHINEKYNGQLEKRSGLSKSARVYSIASMYAIRLRSANELIVSPPSRMGH